MELMLIMAILGVAAWMVRFNLMMAAAVVVVNAAGWKGQS